MKIIGWLREAGQQARERVSTVKGMRRNQVRPKPIVSDLAEFHPARESAARPKPIISVNGRDVSPEDLSRERTERAA
jgi:hypothetical protein